MAGKARGKMIRARAKVRTTHPVTGKYCYPDDETTFTMGKGFQLEEMPKHWEEVEVDEVAETTTSEVENLLELQIKGMTTGRIALYIMAYYGIKIETGQAQETAYHQAIEIIRNPAHKRRPESQILAALKAVNDTPDKVAGEVEAAKLPEGGAKAVVPGKEESGGEVDKPEKALKDYSPDDYDAITREEIMLKMKRMYNVDMANVGNKGVILNKALELENAALEARAISSEE